MDCINLFARLGYPETEIDRRLASMWDMIFDSTAPDSFYRDNGDGTAFIFDTGNNDVRTEGMSYAMMMAVQANRQDVFDRLWTWSMRYMYMQTGVHAGYFAWSCGLDGSKNSHGPAPDGEEYFAAALFFAEARWGGREAPFNYAEWARKILASCVHNGDNGVGYPMWDREKALIKFIPECDFSDPSYHLPHFYRVFAERANPEDRDFWRKAAAASVRYIALAAHPETGLTPEYAYWNGKPNDEKGFGGFYSDAYRVAANIGLNAAWGDTDPALRSVADRLLRFFDGKDPAGYRKYSIDGADAGIPALHPVAIVATNAEAALALYNPDSADAVPSREGTWGLPAHAERAVRLFWNTPPRTGDRRYYDNCLYFFAFYALSGRYLPL